MFAGRYEALEGTDTHQIAVAGAQLHLVGATPEAASHAVYTFLHDLGCRWFMPGAMGEVLPRTRTWPGPDSPGWRNPASISASCGGPMAAPRRPQRTSVIGNANRLGSRRIAHGHNLTNTVPPATYFDEHPEYYALVDGKRQTTQLCTSHPDVVRLSIEHINDYFDQHPEATSYSLCPDDNKQFCECTNCTALDIGKVGGRRTSAAPPSSPIASWCT